MTWVLDSTRIKQTFLRPTSDDGASAPLLATGFRRFCVTAVWGFFCLFLLFDASAEFVRPPKTAVKELKVTRGKQFDAGVVFVDGKFIAPPYTIERYGNVIRINGVQVTQPVVEWSEFLKTQSNLATNETVPAKKALEATAEVKSSAADVAEEDSLEALFEDVVTEPDTKKIDAASKCLVGADGQKVRMEGKFVVNDRVRALINTINRNRTDIDAALRRGGFICFGSAYSMVSGDAMVSMEVLEKLPKLMKASTDEASFSASVRAAGFVYFPPLLIHDLFINRLDYPIIQKRWRKLRNDAEIKAMIEKSTLNTVF